MAEERMVVVGGDAGGMSAASQARRLRPPSDLEIVAFERGRHTSYSACGIPYYVGKVVDDPDRLVARTPAEHAARDITVHIRTEVTSIDLDQRRVTVRDLDAGTERAEPFDILMVATGAVPIRPEMPGDDAEGIFGVQSLGDGLALRDFLDANKPQAAAVVGGGYIGLEMAEAMVHRGIHTTLVDRNAQPMSALDTDMGAMVADALRRLGCDLRLGVPVDGYETDGARVTGVRVGENCVPADVVVLGLGVRPNSDLAAAAGITIGESTRGVAVDRRMRTSAEGVWAAGDCVEVFHRVSQRPAAIALGTHANKQGRVAGINIGGGYATFPGVVGTAVSKVCGVEVARTGLTEREAAAAGFATEAVTVDSRTRAGYFPGSAPITTKLVVERVSGRLLGAQIVGEEGAAKRIDVLACALWNEMGVDEILHLDLGYAPPFSPVWDPVLIAARKAWERLGTRIG